MTDETSLPPVPPGRARFPLGRLLATPGAVETMERRGIRPLTLLTRHLAGDWGDLDQEDRDENEFSVERPLRILSAYGS